MTYNDACKIGSNIEGYVKCTYAKLNEIEIGFIFAFQRDYTQTSTGHESGRNIGDIVDVNELARDGADVHTFVIDAPIVKATASDGEKNVVVQLTPYGRDILYKKLSHSHVKEKTRTVYVVWRVYDKPIYSYNGNQRITLRNAGDRVLVWQKYDKPDMSLYENADKYHYELEEKQVSSGERQEVLNKILDGTARFLVKECAIDWFPTNISNVLVSDPNTGKQVSIDVAIDDAKKRLDRAKAILAGATALAFI